MTTELIGDEFALPKDLEDARLASLHQLQMLHTPPDDTFARITRMARVVLEVPMAAVSLIDADYQWFKQVDGLDIGAAVPRQQTVCRAVIARSYTNPEGPELILPDLREVPEFANLPGVIEGGIRFYAGLPLYGPGGHAVGTFCVYDTTPRVLSAAQADALHELAEWAQFELHQSDEMERAALVQQQLLPGRIGDLPGYSVSTLCVPAFAVGGDFYDHYPVHHGMVFTVADVMGKGIGAAILTATVRGALRAATRALDLAEVDADPAAAVTTVAEQIAEDLACTDTFVTLFHARLDTRSGTVTYVDAGHGVVVLIRADGSTEALPGGGLPLGITADAQWQSNVVTLEPGDTLAIASDGVLDLVGDGSSVGPALAFVAQHSEPDDLCRRVRELATGLSALDDITLVAVRREPGT